MQDLASTEQVAEQEPSVHETLASQANEQNEKPKKKKLELTKRGKLLTHIGILLFVVIAVIIVLDYMTSSEPQAGTTAPAPNSITGAIQTSDSTVSTEQQQRLDVQEQQDLDTSNQTGSTFVQSNLFDVDGFKEVEGSSKIIVGASANGYEKAGTQQQQQQQESAQSRSEVQPVNVLDDATDTTQLGGSVRGRTTGSSSSAVTTEAKLNRITGLMGEFDSSRQQSGRTGSMKTGNRMRVEQEEQVDFGLSDTVIAGNATTGDLSQEFQPRATNTKGKGRGLRVGDTLIGKVKNGLRSTSPSPLLLVEVVQPEELKGAMFSFTPQVAYDNYVFQSNSFNYFGESDQINAIVVTPSANLETGYRTDVDYHRLYKWGMIFFSGIFSGAADYVNNLGGSVEVAGDTVIETNEFDWKKLIASSAGGVADSAQQEVEKAIEIPPTVWIDAGDIIGIMIAEDYNPQWFPFIPKHRNDLLDSRRSVN